MNRRKSIYLFLGGFILACLLGYGLGAEPEGMIRIAGLVLQLGGLVAVAYWLHRAISHLRKWFSELLQRGVTVNLIGTAATAVAGTEDPTVIVGSAGPSYKELIDALEANLQIVREQVTANEKRYRDTLRRAVAQERHEREQAKKQMEDRIQGDLGLQVVSFSWLVLGTILVTIPGELAWLLPY